MNARMIRLLGLVRKERKCPICGWRGYRFEPFGNRALWRVDARCPICGSLERHRAAVLLLKGRILRGQKVLHVAAEELMIPWLVSCSSEYLNIDLNNPAMRRMDLTQLELPDRSRTLVWCSHVLEHIPNDAKALAEIYRVLEPGGVAVLQVPIVGAATYEDETVRDDDERLEKFLQEDHVRLYGLDLSERIKRAGFECEILSTQNLSEVDQTLYSLRHPVFREVFFCRRPVDG